VVGVGVRKEVQRRDSCEAWQRAKLVNSDWEGRDESMKGRSLRHEKLPTTRCSSTELVDDNLCDLSLATHFWDLAHRPGNLGCAPSTLTSTSHKQLFIPPWRLLSRFAVDDHRCAAWLPCWNHTNHTVVPRGHGLARCWLSVVTSASRFFPLSEQHFLTPGRG
jgi:hypothetical protein